jgi:RNA polymerase sigma-70 factor (ECF subfamily)
VNQPTDAGQADKELIKRVLAGDNQAFGIIIQQTEKLVTQIIFQFVKNEEERKDIAQEIYLKVYSKLRGFRHESKLSTWIAQISYNTCLDLLRKKNRLKDIAVILPIEESDDNENNNYSRQIVSPVSVENILSQKILSGMLKKAIQQLPPIYSTLVILFHQEEMRYEEIGRITGLPLGTIKNYLFRARRSLKEILLADYKKEEL